MTKESKRTITLKVDNETDDYIIDLVREFKLHSRPNVIRLLLDYGRSHQDDFEDYIKAVTGVETIDDVSIA